MLTAEEQWKIIQEKERRTRRRSRKRKTLTEQLEDMGGFGHDPDSEQTLREDLDRTDTRHPLQYSKESISECEVSFGESSFWESKKRLFKSWIFQATRLSSWIEQKDLPLFFRFALRRPIMDERSFQATLQAMNLQLDTSMGDVRLPHTRPIGRSRKLMLGIDVDHEENVHPSSKFRYALPRGGAENLDRVREGVTRMFQDDEEDVQQLLRRQLWTVYEHVQDGSVPLETATWHYRDAFDTQDMSDEDLVTCLPRYGIPTDHIATNERNARRGSAHCPFPSGVESFREEIGDIADADAYERGIIKELVNYVRLYRGGAFQEHEVVHMIQHCLDGFELEASIITDILTDLEKDEDTAALLMWEDAGKYDSTSVSSGPLVVSSSSLSSSEEENERSPEQQEARRAFTVPDPQGKDGDDRDAAAASPVNGNKSHDGPVTEDMHYREDFKDNSPEQFETMSIDQPLVSPSEIAPGKRPTYGHADEVESRVQAPDSPKPKPASPAPATEGNDSQADVKSYPETPGEEANVSPGRPSSPDNGMTTGIWGLLMPTKEARKLACNMKLPQYTIDEQVRSISPRRTNRRKASYAKTIVTFPKSKRKASMALDRQTPPKSPKHGDHSEIFAREGENQDAFVLSHFDPEDIRSCTRCLRLSCDCLDRSPPRSRSEPDCLKCLQPYMCDCLSQVDEANPTAPPNGTPSFDARKAELADRTRPEPPKQQITLLSYLARVLHNEDVLASIKQLERLSPADTIIADAQAILDHIQKGYDAGEELDTTGNDDREAVRILKVVVQSSPTLTDYSQKLHREATREKTSATSVDHCHDGAGESLDFESSLFKSSPGQEHVTAPPSHPVASAATLPESQSKVANGPILPANKTPFAKGVSPYLPAPAPDPRVPRLEPSSNTEDAVHLSPLQAGTFPDPSAAGNQSRAENQSNSPAGGEFPTPGGHPSKAEVFSDLPAGSPPSSTAGLSHQVSDNPVNAEGDTDRDTFGAPLKKQRYSNLRNSRNSEVETGQPISPRPGVMEPPSPRSPSKISPEITSPATRSLESKEMSNNKNATARSCLKGPGFDSLPLWPAQPGLPKKAGKEWMGMTPDKALEHAQEEAFNQRQSLAFYLEERRAVRTRIKKENDFANSKWSDHSFFQSSNGLSGSSGTATTPALNKLFDKYRGTSDI